MFQGQSFKDLIFGLLAKRENSQIQVKYRDNPVSMMPSVLQHTDPFSAAWLGSGRHHLSRIRLFKNQPSLTFWEGPLRLENVADM